jgi:hypothetical protein
MPPELRERIERESKINGRSLNAEIVNILQRCCGTKKVDSVYRVEDAGKAEYSSLADSERQLLTLFKRMEPEKQLALLSLIK